MTIVLFLLACSEPQPVDITEYDQTCTVDEDCTAVFVGDVCGCDCTRDGINVADAEAYNSVRDEIFLACDSDEVMECMACPEVQISCDAGTCVVADE